MGRAHAESQSASKKKHSKQGIPLDLWLRHLELQARVTAFADVKSFLELPEWRRASEILDVGCSYGTHLHSLARRHPEKRFVGLDLEQAAIDYASVQYKRANLRFVSGDLYRTSLPQQFDFLLAKLLVPHLSDLERFFSFAHAHLRPGGALSLIDSYEGLKRLFPEVPALSDLLERAARVNRRVKQERATMKSAPLAAARCGFGVRSEAILSGVTDAEFSKRDLLEMVWVNAQVLSELYRLPLDGARLQEELQNWALREGAFGTLAVHVLTLVRE